MLGKQSWQVRRAGCGSDARRAAAIGTATRRLAFTLGLLLMIFGPPAQAQFVTDTVPTGNSPQAIGINSVTNKIYVANADDGTLTVIDGATHSTATMAVGSNPQAVAVNPVTNKIYVANTNPSGTVTVIDGATNETTTLAVGGFPAALAVNPMTNRVYVANQVANGTVSVIDGARDTVSATISVGGLPSALAADPATNRIYVASGATDSVTVLNGADNSTSTVSTGPGSNPAAVAVGSITHKAYVACPGAGSLVVLDVGNNRTSPVAVGGSARILALDPVSNWVYVVDSGQNAVTVIDGASDTVVAAVAVGASPVAVAINSATHQIYTANLGDNTVTAIDGATNRTTTLAVGAGPEVLGIDPVTNKLYVANESAKTVSVVDGATNHLETVSVGSNPTVVFANPVADKVYVASGGGNSVTVVDGSTNATTEVAAGNSPQAFALNSLTNQVYVANFGDQTVTVIDGASNATTMVDLGAYPRGVAVNPATQRVYVSTTNPNTLAVIDGTTNRIVTAIPLGATPGAVAVNPSTNTIYATSPSANGLLVMDGAANAVAGLIAVGDSPRSLAVNPATNRVNVVNDGENTVTVIDGMTAGVLGTVAVGNGPHTVALNPLTNWVYVANQNDSSVTVIDGSTNAPTTVTLTNLQAPSDLVVDPVTNKIYVAGNSSGNIAVIDGVGNTITTVVDANALRPRAVAVNLVTGKVYVANQGSSNLTVLTEQQAHESPLQASVLPLTGNLSASLAPQLEFRTTSALLPNLASPKNLLYQVDTWQGTWLAATSLDGAQFSGATPALLPGFHVLYAYTGDGQSANSGAVHSQSGFLNSRFAAYGFVVSPPSAAVCPASLDFGYQRRGVASASRTVTLSNQGGGPLALADVTASGDFRASDTCGAALAAFASCAIDVTFTPTAKGQRQGTLTITENRSDAAGPTLTVTLSGDATTGPLPQFSNTQSTTPTLVFPAQLVGTTSTLAETLTNVGDASLTTTAAGMLSVATAPGFTETDNCGTSLAAGASCQINVTFAPTNVLTLASANLGNNGLLLGVIGFGAGSNYTSTNAASGYPPAFGVQGTGEVFAFNLTTGTATVNAGQTATFAFNLAPVGGFNQTVSLTCGTVPLNTTCTLSSTSVPLNGTNAVTVTATVVTTARSGAAPRPRHIPPTPSGPRVPVAYWWLGLAALFGMALAMRRSARLRWLLPAALTLVLMWAACSGGGSSSLPTGTPAGSWTLTVTGTAGSLTNYAYLTLNVN
jgi:YVTN family beta-propeller protein